MEIKGGIPMYDIGIIGAGTAGMTAAIYGLRAGKSVLLIEEGAVGGQIVVSPHVENYPGIASMSGSEFANNLLEQAMNLGAETRFTAVKAIRNEKDKKVIVSDEGEIPCKTVIIATGAKHRHLGVKREEEFVGAGVSYCAVCDGAFFKGMDTAVVGGGNTALQDAIFLSSYCRRVYLIHRRDAFRGEEHLVSTLKAKENVEFVLDSVVEELKGDDLLEGVKIKNVKTGEERELSVEGIFVAIGQAPSNDRFADVVKLDGAGYVLASEDCHTSANGIFTAGDCRTKEVRQLTTAAADGAVAAIAASQYIDRYYK